MVLVNLKANHQCYHNLIYQYHQYLQYHQNRQYYHHNLACNVLAKKEATAALRTLARRKKIARRTCNNWQPVSVRARHIMHIAMHIAQCNNAN